MRSSTDRQIPRTRKNTAHVSTLRGLTPKYRVKCGSLVVEAIFADLEPDQWPTLRGGTEISVGLAVGKAIRDRCKDCVPKLTTVNGYVVKRDPYTTEGE